ncbi:MAG: N-acetylmuramoyl-L-alanine amidase, partial [Rickettsiales bacterium]|nr:N-acetylmuramoyl-L-alanine amidase [Rickettsiales bacterium]
DPGHGGKDPGAIGKGKTYEKNIVLSTSKLLEQELKQRGFTVYLTRRSDVFLKLQERSKFAVDKKADLFISVHADSHPKEKITGLSVYTLSEKASDAESQRLAERENAVFLLELDADRKLNKNAINILSDFKIKQTKEESIVLSKLVLSKVKSDKTLSLLDSTQRSAPFAVLKSHIPSVLVELGYISNREEEKKLKSVNYQKKLVKKLADAVSSYPFIED